MNENDDYVIETIDENIFDEENQNICNTNVSEEDLQKMDEDSLLLLAQTVEIEIDKYEDILLKGETNCLDYEELKDIGYDEDEHKRLKKLDKQIYKNIKEIRKTKKENGFFAVVPMWAIILFIICCVFTIVPVNPFFPILIYGSLYNSFTSTFMKGVGGAYVFYFLYIGIFIIIELASLIILYIEGIKNKEKKAAFKSTLILFIINILVIIPSLVIFLSSALNQ